MGTWRGRAHYWTKSFLYSDFHPLTHGGWRHGIFHPSELSIVKGAILAFLEEHPTATSIMIKEEIEFLFDRTLSISTLYRILNRLGFSWKVPTRFQTAKYTMNNIDIYLNFLEVVQKISWQRLKFLDESHIVDNQLTGGRVCWLRRSRCYTRLNSRSLYCRGTLTILLDLRSSTHPILAQWTTESNNSVKFLDFIIAAGLSHAFEPGDFLILDNASIHSAKKIYDDLISVLDYFSVHLIFLPAYSPELNPCELVFGFMKNHLRRNRTSDPGPLKERVFDALGKLPKSKIESFYRHCLFPKTVLPELGLDFQ